MLRTAPILFTSLSVAQQFAPSDGHGPIPYMPQEWFTLIALADVDGDGDMDAGLNDLWSGFMFARRTGVDAWVTTPLFPTMIAAAVWADFDGDGDLDLIVGSGVSTPAGVPAGVLRNDGATFTWTGQINGTLQGESKDIAVGDIDGDGDLDAILGTSIGLQVLHNNGAGAFTAAPVNLIARNDVRPALFDRDGDGDLDLIAGTLTGLVFFDNNAGVFTNVSNQLPTTTAAITKLAAHDLDMDGRVDIAFSHGTSFSVLWNDPAGWLLAPLATGDSAAFGVGIADLDVDGAPDVVLRLSVGCDWLRNAGNRSFVRLPALRQAGASLPSAVAIGDLTGDGKPDAVAGWSNDAVQILHGSAPLPFTDPAEQTNLMPIRTPTAGGNLTSVGDIDGDGRLDIVLPNPPQTVRVDQNGTWTSQPIHGARTTYQQAWLVDLDQDSDLDLLLGNSRAPQPPLVPLQRLTNDGAGNYTFAQDILSPFANGILAFADVDGDGDTDILSARGVGQVAWFDNQGAAGFVDVGVLPNIQTSSSANTLLVEDFNGDGNVDVISGFDPGNMPVFLGNGLGVFTAGGSIPWAAGAFALGSVAGDVDGDGDLDLIVMENVPQVSGLRALFRNDGSANFTRVNGAFPNTSHQGTLHLFDMDGDGDLDLLNRGFTDSLFRNDGTGLFIDATDRLSTTSPQHTMFFDFDEDGDIDLLSDLTRRMPNRLRDAVSLQPVRPGGQLQVRMQVAPEVPGPNTVFLPCFSFGSGPSSAVPGLAGKLKLSAATASLVAVLPAPTGVATWTASIPVSPAFVGLELCTQAIVLGPHVPPGFTNMVYERILP